MIHRQTSREHVSYGPVDERPAWDVLSRRVMASMTSPEEQVATLESLLSISVADPRTALTAAGNLVATAFGADKVDVFLYDAERDTLVALSSTQPLSALEKKHGLDMLPLANGGRCVEVFSTGVTFLSGAVDTDRDELLGIRETLKIRSEIGVALNVAGERRGVLLLASVTKDRWTEAEGRFAETVSRWVSAVLQQAETVKKLAETAVATGRRLAAEELITIVAHDVRNLIYPVDLSMHVIERRAERERRDDDVRDAAKARKGLARLSSMVNDVLDVSRVEQGLMALTLEPVAIVPFVEEIATLLSTPARAVAVSSGEEVDALVDPARLRQSIENVLANALKHSPAGSTVDVNIERRSTPAGPFVAITITDRGAGVSAELAPHIFDRFVTGANRGAGLGLGLFLARQIALLHQGDLALESPLTGGARFTLTLPCDESRGR